MHLDRVFVDEYKKCKGILLFFEIYRRIRKLTASEFVEDICIYSYGCIQPNVTFVFLWIIT